MPQRYVCSECGFVLWESEGDELEPRKNRSWDINYELKTPQEVMEMLDGRCPRCGHRLAFHPRNITVKVS